MKINLWTKVPNLNVFQVNIQTMIEIKLKHVQHFQFLCVNLEKNPKLWENLPKFQNHNIERN